MTWGYHLNIYRENGILYPLRLPLDSHCHALIAGESGSGKSTALLYLIGKLLQSYPGLEITICDFKNSDDFHFLKNYGAYYAGDDCYAGVMEYYRQFTETRQKGKTLRRSLLIFDEYPAFVSYLTGKDKIDKKKRTNDVLNAVAEILMLGRGLSSGIWIVTQRPDSTLFSGGARDNFMVRIILGNSSKELRGMLLSGEEIPKDKVYRRGEGLLLADGLPLIEVKYPVIRDMENWKGHILQCLGCV